MGMLQRYRNKLRSDERKEKARLIERGEVKVERIKVRVPGLKKGKK